MRFSLQSHANWRAVKIAGRTCAGALPVRSSIGEAQSSQEFHQGGHPPLSFGLYLYTSQTSYATQASALAKYYTSFDQAASRKTPRVYSCKTPSHMSVSTKHSLTRQFSEKHYVTQLNFQSNQKFPLQNLEWKGWNLEDLFKQMVKVRRNRTLKKNQRKWNETLSQWLRILLLL